MSRLAEFNKTKRLTTEQWVEKAKAVHGDKYDYSITVYTTAKTKLKIICPEHGVQEMLPHHHIKGYGCSKCGKAQINVKNGNKFTQEQFLERVKDIPGVDFTNVNYTSKRAKIRPVCKIHGEYETTAEVALKGHGCPICKKSKGEMFIKEYLDSKGIFYIEQMGFPGCVHKRNLKFDFFIPSINTCIEYDGKQHFKPIKFWGGEEGLKDRQLKDKIKTEFCKEKNINLIRISYLCDKVEKLEKINFNL